MRDLETLIGIKASTAFEIGGLFIPANSIAGFLHRYIDPALFFCDLGHPIEFTKSGSLTRVKFRGRYFALVSSHQVSPEGYDFDQLIIRDPRGRNLLSSHYACFQTEMKDPREDLDLLVFEFTEIVRAGDLPEYIWYDLCREAGWEKIPLPMRALCIGYPSEVNNIEYDAERYAAKAVSVWGTPTKSVLSRRAAFSPDGVPIYEPNGMSGGGVFGIFIDHEVPVIFLAGMLTEATKATFNFVTSTRIIRVLERAVEQS